VRKVFKKIYSGPAYPDIWHYLFEIISLTKDLGQELSSKLNYEYPTRDHMNVVAYLEKVRALPREAKAIR
jgi:aminoglycoside 6-adenylyltransferase